MPSPSSTENTPYGADIETFAVRSVVNIRKNQNPILVKFDVVGSLKGQKARKIDIANGRVVNDDVALAHSMPTSISIAQLLDSVKGVFDDTLSNDVYEHFGMNRNDKSDFAKDLRYSLADTGVYSLEDAWAEEDKKYHDFTKNPTYVPLLF